MKVSIITICYNAEDTIRDTIESVLSQSYPFIEYIIKDGGSTDNTLKIVDEYKDRIAIVQSKQDMGLYDALNQGIELATGDVVGALHADDVFATTNVVQQLVDTFSKFNSDAVYGDLQYVAREDVTKVVRNWKSGNYKENSFYHGWMPPHPTFYVKRELFETYGNYNTSFRSAGDYELMLRFIHKNKISLTYLPEVMVLMRVGGKSNVSLKNRIRANKEDRKAWEINGLKSSPFTMLKKPLRKISQYFKK